MHSLRLQGAEPVIASEVLLLVQRMLEDEPPAGNVTWGRLAQLIYEAQRAVDYAEHEDSTR